MLALRNIAKNYDTGEIRVEALKGISVDFRRNEFVAVLGPSGCGKTTLLNIVGGLDRYSDGDVTINGKSTKGFRDKDWDAYRNHSVGFVFQSYNLIPHQTALVNVELALTLSGVSRAERRQRAINVLTQVGLADQLYKRPNQMSGGQMQRVAIARALINNPDILLADEPTGALDSETSTQVLDILQEVAKNRLVIMVTHNAELAEKYANRIIRLEDGLIISDSDPWDASPRDAVARDASATAVRPARQAPESRPSMSFGTALSLSLNNLLSKMARTLLTAFAASIGIIGIALILSLSSGFQDYIADVEQEMLSAYPIMIERETMDAGGLSALGARGRPTDARDDDAVYVNTTITDSMNMQVGQMRRNDLVAFKQHLDEHAADIAPYVTAVTYDYDVDFTIYAADATNGLRQVHPGTLFDELGLSSLMEMNPGSSTMMAMSGLNVWHELIHDEEFLQSRYELIAGRWPKAVDDLVLIVDANNEIGELALYALGLADPRDAARNRQIRAQGQRVDVATRRFAYEEILDLRYKLVVPADRYARNETTGTWVDMSLDLAFMQDAAEQGMELKVIGVLRETGESLGGSPGSIAYSAKLIDYVIDAAWERPIVQEQLADPSVNVFSGKSFGRAVTAGGPGSMAQFALPNLSPEQQRQLAALSPSDIAALMNAFGNMDGIALGALAAPRVPADTYGEVLALLGVVDRAQPTSLTMYTKDFQARSEITDFIAAYNATQSAAGDEQRVITYTDFIRLILSSVTSIINSISYVLIAFVAISLVVSSIMIGIFSYISVLERTKEIGILRSIGASKRDISRVFNAETIIVGFAAGTLGVVVTVLLCIPVNMVIEAVSGIAGVAKLPISAALALIAVSMLLTVIAGVIPARIAAGKDPVTALRTE